MLAACTIVSKNYLPFARVLARSWREHHPEAEMFVLLVDRVDGAFDPAAEPFRLLEMHELGNLPDLASFAFKYTILELNTAVKPFFLEVLFERYGVETLLYLDPDIWVASRMAELLARLETASIVLTPHLTEPITDELHPSEMSILQAGAYNLGFIGLRKSPPVAELLRWWQERMLERCVVDLPRGLFVDQKWIDLVPGLFNGVEILTHRGYNTAYWNLHGRRVTASDPWAFNGDPLRFFHFSGFDPADIGRISKHQNRFMLGELPALKGLFALYRERLLAEGYHQAKPWPYAYGRFDNGVAIPDVVRSLYFSLGPGPSGGGRARFGDPFAAAGEHSFFRWAIGPARAVDPEAPYLSRALDHLRKGREDLVAAFPDPHGADLPRFADWLLEGGRREYKLDDVWLEGLAPLAALPQAPGAAVASRTRRMVRRANTSSLAGRLKWMAKRLLGEERMQAIKRRLPGLAPRPAEQPSFNPAPLARLAISRFGVNLGGYLSAETGMGEGARGITRALAARGIPHSLTNIELGVVARREHRSFGGADTNEDYDLNLLFVNADQVPHVARHLGHERFRGKVNIGFWLWELEEFPAKYRPAFDYFHEVWTPSTFCLDAISAASPIPVRRVGLPVGFEVSAELLEQGARARGAFGLPEDRFLFLFVFDFLSYIERKNPRALLAAFRRAFAAGEKVSLVLKTVNASFNAEAAAELRREAEGLPVIFLDDYLGKDDVHRLMAACDAYVSLHRSEGFGLTLAEAMFLGKPVIATGYSANMDFMEVGNSLPVRYRLVEIEDEAGPYRQGARWAAADVEHAAEQMRSVFLDRELARGLGAEGRRRMLERHGPEAVGDELAQRLRRLLEQVNGPGGELFGL